MSMEWLEALNPAPEVRGNPGPSQQRRQASKLAGACIAASLLLGGSILLDQTDSDMEAPTSVTVATDAPHVTAPEPHASEPEPEPSVNAEAGDLAVEVPEASEVTVLDPSTLADAGFDAGEFEIVAEVMIPAIDVHTLVVEGVTGEALREARVGHYPETALPGDAGNVALAGQRVTFGGVFERIDELAPGDVITFRTLSGLFDYVVTGSAVVAPDDVFVLEDVGDNRVTLTATHPLYSARERIVVVAELQGEPVPALRLADIDPGAEPG